MAEFIETDPLVEEFLAREISGQAQLDAPEGFAFLAIAQGRKALTFESLTEQDQLWRSHTPDARDPYTMVRFRAPRDFRYSQDDRNINANLVLAGVRITAEPQSENRAHDVYLDDSQPPVRVPVRTPIVDGIVVAKLPVHQIEKEFPWVHPVLMD